MNRHREECEHGRLEDERAESGADEAAVYEVWNMRSFESVRRELWNGTQE